MKKVGVFYWSNTGNTEEMAEAVAQGAREAGAAVDVLDFEELTPEKAADYDALALGCPAMGVDQLEEGVVRPAWDEAKASLAGKKAVLFGSYGWGGGIWLRNWEKEAREAGLVLAASGLAIQDAIDEAGEQACQRLGRALVI